MDNKDYEYIQIKIKHELKTEIEHGLLIGFEKIIINSMEEEFLILLTNNYTLKIFNLLYYDIIEVDIKLSYMKYKLNSTDTTTITTIKKTIDELISYMGEINNTVNNKFININFYDKDFIFSKNIDCAQIVNNKVKEPSLFIIKRKLPLINICNKIYNKSN